MLGAGVIVLVLLVVLLARPKKGERTATPAPDAAPRRALQIPIIPDVSIRPPTRPRPDAATPRAAAEPDAAPKPVPAIKKPGHVRKPYPRPSAKPKPRPIAKPKLKRPKRKDDLKKTINPFAE